VVAAFVLAAALYIAVVAVDSPGTRLLTWPWYNNVPRFAALVVLPSVIAATAALAAVPQLIERSAPSLRHLSAWTAVVPAVALIVVTGGYVDEHRAVLRPYFSQEKAQAFATDAELRALRELGKGIPQDAIVAANPWNGGSYLYLVSGQKMLFPTEKALISDDRKLLARRLHAVGRSARVCDAVRRQGVRYAITGGEPPSVGRRSVARGAYRGVDRIRPSDAFRQVGRAGPYTLYEIVGCRES
jgi:hypothetical protein